MNKTRDMEHTFDGDVACKKTYKAVRHNAVQSFQWLHVFVGEEKLDHSGVPEKVTQGRLQGYKARKKRKWCIIHKQVAVTKLKKNCLTSSCCGISCIMSFCGHWSVFLFGDTKSTSMSNCALKPHCTHDVGCVYIGYLQIFSLVNMDLTGQRTCQFGGRVYRCDFRLLCSMNTEKKGRREERKQIHQNSILKFNFLGFEQVK